MTLHKIGQGGANTRGFGLVELLVAMTLSLVLLGGVAAMFASSRGTYEANDRLSRVEENGRFALDMIVRDLRVAGYVGCNKGSEMLTSLTGGLTGMMDYNVGVIGYNAGASTWTPAVPTKVASGQQTGSDVLLVRVPTPGAPALRLTAPMTVNTDELSVPKFPAGHEGAFKKNQILMITDCQKRTFFEVTDYNAQTGVLKHEKSDPTATTPGNESGSLKWVYAKSASTIGLQAVSYYVKLSPQNIPTLYRRIDGTAEQAIVEGVESLQIRFGEDTGVEDRIADKYVTANSVVDARRIVSVNIALLVRAPEVYGVAKSRTYQVLDQSITKNDGYTRRVFATSATVHNWAM